MTKPTLFSTEMVQAILEGRKTQTRRIKKSDKPQFEIGDTLWVRETWDYYETSEECIDENTIEYRIAYAYKALNVKPKINEIQWAKVSEDKYWKAQEKIDYEETHDISQWKPSIHMPREAARIFLEVVNVRAERLQDISEKDAFAEGVIKEHSPVSKGVKWSDTVGKASLESFKTLWISLYGDQSWDDNPFVWVYEFKRIEKPKDF